MVDRDSSGRVAVQGRADKRTTQPPWSQPERLVGQNGVQGGCKLLIAAFEAEFAPCVSSVELNSRARHTQDFGYLVGRLAQTNIVGNLELSPAESHATLARCREPGCKRTHDLVQILPNGLD